MARIALTAVFAVGLIPAWVAVPCQAQPGTLDIDRRCSTIECVEELARTYCHWSSSTAGDCRRFVRALEDSARAASRDFMLCRARALGALEGLVWDDDAERNRLRQGQTEIYGILIRNDPRDAEALRDLALITGQRDEKLALFRRAAAADPRSPLILRLFATTLALDGTREEMAESVDHMRKAYEIAEVPHRWHLAQIVVDHMVRVGLHQEALEFQRSALSEMGVPNAEQVVRRAMTGDGAGLSRELVSAVALLCDRRTIRLGTTHPCVNGIDALSAATIAQGAYVSKATLDTIAHAALDALGDTDADEQDRRLWERLQAALARFSGTLLETPLLLYARAQAMSMLGTSSAVELPSMLLERAVTLAPSDGDTRVRLGQAYMNEGRVAEAIAQFEVAIPLSSGHNKVSNAQYDLVLALRKAGQTERADRLEREIGK